MGATYRRQPTLLRLVSETPLPASRYMLVHQSPVALDPVFLHPPLNHDRASSRYRRCVGAPVRQRRLHVSSLHDQQALSAPVPRAPVYGTATKKRDEAEHEKHAQERLIAARVWQRGGGSGLLWRSLWCLGGWYRLWWSRLCSWRGPKASFGCQWLVRIDDKQREKGRLLVARITFLDRRPRRQRAHIPDLHRFRPMERVVVLKRASADIDRFGARVSMNTRLAAVGGQNNINKLEIDRVRWDAF